VRIGVVYNARAARANAMRSILGSSFALLLVACGASHEDAPPSAQPGIENGPGGAQPGSGGEEKGAPACPNGMTDPNASALVFDGAAPIVT
jgi:hypothetical protein